MGKQQPVAEKQGWVLLMSLFKIATNVPYSYDPGQYCILTDLHDKPRDNSYTHTHILYTFMYIYIYIYIFDVI